MRHVGHFNPEWGYLAPAPNLLRTARVFVVAVAIGATASAAVIFSLVERPAAETSVAARTLVSSTESSRPARDTQPVAQQPAQQQSGRALWSLAPSVEIPGAAAPGATAGHAGAGSREPNKFRAAPSPRGLPAAASIAESPRTMVTDSPPSQVQVQVRDNNAALAVEAAPAPAPTPAFKGPVKKPRTARAAAPPRYDVPRYAAPRYETMQRGPYALLRQYGTFGQEY